MLSAFSERMASLAVRDHSQPELRAGLIAAQLAFVLTDDIPELLPAISLLYRASDMIGADPIREFLAVAELAGNPPDSSLARFLQRSPEKKRIERMGFAESLMRWVSDSGMSG
ncbi:hypothetical protein [Paractinoplanes toevensis]|uniref:Uncharacterized protein n=1 Tax=Paractinoplanes toevensis TaxID=571911 RepID=A0A919TIS8_9ACTN|nr:hypothetical protein [Actinoplanes toevensis]GIM94676.1 hypothetical protein Ato02nite_064690 [Actinoplanes toevensis]